MCKPCKYYDDGGFCSMTGKELPHDALCYLGQNDVAEFMEQHKEEYDEPRHSNLFAPGLMSRSERRKARR